MKRFLPLALLVALVLAGCQSDITKTANYQAGWDNGYVKGQSEGYQSGYKDASVDLYQSIYDSVREDIISEMYDSIRDDVFWDGYSQGYDACIEENKDNWIDEGFKFALEWYDIEE